MPEMDPVRPSNGFDPDAVLADDVVVRPAAELANELGWEPQPDEGSASGLGSHDSSGAWPAAPENSRRPVEPVDHGLEADTDEFEAAAYPLEFMRGVHEEDEDEGPEAEALETHEDLSRRAAHEAMRGSIGCGVALQGAGPSPTGGSSRLSPRVARRLRTLTHNAKLMNRMAFAASRTDDPTVATHLISPSRRGRGRPSIVLADVGRGAAPPPTAPACGRA